LIPRAGIDGGGVFKEFLTSLAKEVFDSDRGLWLSTEQHELYPNPHSYATDGMWRASTVTGFSTDQSSPAHSLAWFRFVGRILGKALYEGILVDVAFAGFFLAKVG
jgi:ubiquitin-protein ligase E3 C